MAFINIHYPTQDPLFLILLHWSVENCHYKICGKEKKKLRKRPAYLQKRETTAHEVLYLIQLILAYLFINIWGHHDRMILYFFSIVFLHCLFFNSFPPPQRNSFSGT